MSWGTHFCLFYETRQDFLDILIPYFKVGLENHEFCLCVASEPVIAEEATQALRETLPEFEHYLSEGQIEIVSHMNWYLKDGHFDPLRVRQGWLDKLKQAHARGYAGMRFAANVSWLEQQDWNRFAEYEGKLDDVFRESHIIGVCAYALNRCSAADTLDVVRHHQSTLIRRDGAWESLESAQLMSAREEVLKLNNELEQRVIERTAELATTNEQLRAEIVERMRVEEALRESEEKFSAAFRASPIALVIASMDGKYVEMNQAFCDLLGYSREELLGKTAIDLGIFNTESRQEWIETLERAGGAMTNIELSFRLSNGISRTTLSSVEPITLHGVPHRLSTVLDITERKRAEEALQRSESNFRILADKSLQGIAIFQEQKMVYANASIARISGYTVEELKSMSLEQIIALTHPIDRSIAVKRVRRQMAGEELSSSIELRILRKDGSTSWVQAFNNPIQYNGQPAFLSTIIDITERKQVEEALRESEALYRFLAENTNDLLILYDLEGNRVYVSPSITRVLGWLPTEVFGGIHPEDLQASKETWQRIVAGEKTIFTYRHAHADGSWRWLEAWGSLVYYRDQPHVMAVSRDITERKQTEEALQESRERLQVALQAAQIGTGEWDIQADRIFLSDSLQRIFGFASDTVHTKFEEIVQRIYPEDRQMFLSKVEEAFAGKTGFGMDYRVVWPDNSIHWLTAWAHIFYNDIGKPTRLIGAVMDITERKQAEKGIREYATRMAALAEISRTFVEAGLDYQSILNTVAQRSAEIIGDSCVITLFSDDAQRSFPVAFHHPNPEARAMMHDALLHTWQGGTDTERYRTLLAGNSIYVPTVNAEEFRVTLEPEFLPYLDAVGTSSILIVPLQFQSRVIGTLGITRDRQGNPYTRDDLTLLQNIADRAAMSIQNAQLFRQVEGAREQLGALSKRLLEVQESERQALTTELHDRVGQNLTGLSIILQNIKALLSEETAQKLGAKFDDAQALVEDTTRQIRDIMAELHLPELEDYGLAAALETYADRVASRGNLKLITDLPDLAPPPLPSDIRIALFRAAQEAISNVLKHAGATQLEVRLEGRDGKIRLKVEDDGTGFEPEAASQKELPSWGLKIMRERIESIGGNVQIESQSGKGTQVIFEIERPS